MFVPVILLNLRIFIAIYKKRTSSSISVSYTQSLLSQYIFCGVRDRMIFGFKTTCAISEFKSRSWRGVLDTRLCDKVSHCQWLATSQWFSRVSSTNKTYNHDITEILLKVALNTITLYLCICQFHFLMSLNEQFRKVSQFKTYFTFQKKMYLFCFVFNFLHKH